MAIHSGPTGGKSMVNSPFWTAGVQSFQEEEGRGNGHEFLDMALDNTTGISWMMYFLNRQHSDPGYVMANEPEKWDAQ